MTKAQLLKWNTDVIGWLSAELDFEIDYHSEYHFSLIHPKRGRMDYWPSTGKAMWMENKRAVLPYIPRAFHIPDIEKYLQDHFA